MNPIQLSIFASKIAAVADEMGAVLQRSAFSPNIRDRLDYSCALFDANAELCAQAAHIPVHLGSMAYAMESIVSQFDWQPGDTLILNDPYLGGTHLPDVTLISPAFVEEQLCGFVANRAHHANIGSDSPGSMPISSSLEEEGLVIPPTMLARNGKIDQAAWQHICDELGDASETSGDLLAQISANKKGLERLQALASGMGLDAFQQGLNELNLYGESLARERISLIPEGCYNATEYMDDDGQGSRDIPLCVSIRVAGSEVELDFAGTSAQVRGNINCPISVAAAGVYYVFRCLLPEYTPACAGIFRPIHIKAPLGSLLNAERPAAVAAGNVETSSRVVDLVIAALAKAMPEAMPAASQGTMNNLAMGSAGDRESQAWSYYETIAGGMGASKFRAGLSARHSHMTNTFNTPIEVLETSYPVRVNRYAIRRNSGGKGQFRGGDGIVREYDFLKPASASLLTERRYQAPPGSSGGEAGEAGLNLLNGKPLPPKCEFRAEAGDRLCIETPGGGGYGLAELREAD